MVAARFEDSHVDRAALFSLGVDHTTGTFMTVTSTEDEVEGFKADENKAIATLLDVIGRPQAYRKRLVEPSTDLF